MRVYLTHVTAQTDRQHIVDLKQKTQHGCLGVCVVKTEHVSPQHTLPNDSCKAAFIIASCAFSFSTLDGLASDSKAARSAICKGTQRGGRTAIGTGVPNEVRGNRPTGKVQGRPAT